jgi:salicylate hydroxylase
MMDATTGDQVAQIPVDEPFRRRFRNPYAVIHRADLHGVFLEACRAHPNVTLLTSRRVVAYENKAGRAVAVTEAGERVEADGLIGADGGRSKIREQLTGGDPLRLTGHVAYRAVLPIDKMPEELRWNAATLWGGPKCHMVHYPLQGWKTFNLVAVFVGESMDAVVNVPGSRDEVLGRFGKSVDIVRRLLEVPTEWRRWSLADREPIENWTDGRVTLLGDAAHPTLQYFAQGACMAMEDAVNLADKVGRFGDDLASAFASYQKERIVRAYRVVLSSRMLGMMFHAKGVERLIRNSVLGARTPEEFYNGLEWLYGGNGLTG